MRKRTYKKLARARLKTVFKEKIDNDVLDILYNIAKNKEMCHHLIDVVDSLGSEQSEMVWLMNLMSDTTIKHIDTLKKLVTGTFPIGIKKEQS